MASGTTHKLRLVRCPKCQLVLLEVADFPVYKCGGCDTILVELSQESGGNQNISTDSHGENLSVEGQHNNHYEKDQNTSSDSDCGELHENLSNEEQQNGNGQLQLESLEYCNGQQLGVFDEVSLSTELYHENEELMLVAEANLEAEANDKIS